MDGAPPRELAAGKKSRPDGAMRGYTNTSSIQARYCAIKSRAVRIQNPQRRSEVQPAGAGVERAARDISKDTARGRSFQQSRKGQASAGLQPNMNVRFFRTVLLRAKQLTELEPIFLGRFGDRSLLKVSFLLVLLCPSDAPEPFGERCDRLGSG